MGSLTFQIAGLVGTQITVTEVINPLSGLTELRFDVSETNPNGVVGDLRGLFFDLNGVTNSTWINGLAVDGSTITASLFAGSSVSNLGDGVNVNGEIINEMGKFDAGVRFGGAGIGSDDIRATSFTLSHAGESLSLDLIAQMDFAVRYTSVGVDGGQRTDSLKLAGEATAAPNAHDDAFFVPENGVTPLAVLVNDTDADGNSLVVTSASITGGHGTVSVAPDGGSILFNPGTDYDYLAAGQTATVSVHYDISDGHGGTDGATATLTVMGANDTAIIGGVDTGAVTEDVGVIAGNLTATGALTVHDADAGQSAFQVLTNMAGTYGSFNIDAAGNWTYVADNSQAVIQGLGQGESLSETFSVASVDGTTHEVNVAIHGANDAPINLVDIDGSADAVRENLPSFTYTGITVQAADIDGDTVSYWFKRPDGTLDNDVGGFVINTSTGSIFTDTRLPPTNDGIVLDYETRQSHQLTVYAIDGHGGETSATFTVSVLNDPSDDPVSLTAGTTGYVVDNNRDGVVDNAVPGPFAPGSWFFDRQGIAEIDASTVTDGVTAANLKLTVNGWGGDFPADLHVSLYTGNGSVDLSDFNAGTEAATFTTVRPDGVNGTFFYTIALDPNVVNSVLAGGDFVGVNLHYEGIPPTTIAAIEFNPPTLELIG